MEQIKDHTKAIADFKKTQEQAVIDLFHHAGGVEPFIIMQSWHPDKGYSAIYLEIPGILITNDSFKDILVNTILPDIREKLQEKGYIPLCIVYGSESWLRKWDHSKGPLPDNYKEILKPVGAVTLMMETEFTCEMKAWEIEGDTINGPAVPLQERAASRLIPMDMNNKKMPGGRFSNLFGNKHQN
jgi:hypothetical protein